MIKERDSASGKSIPADRTVPDIHMKPASRMLAVGVSRKRICLS